jgi:hypothetical protein
MFQGYDKIVQRCIASRGTQPVAVVVNFCGISQFNLLYIFVV